MIRTETVKRQRDAHGAACEDCAAVFNVTTCPYWHWSKSVWMHRQSGHRVSLYRIVAP
jgi:hypothetical protein